MNEIINVPMAGQRSLATVTAEIRTLQETAKRVVLNASVEIGRRLTEAKSMVAHGEWGTYLREELGFSQSTANNHMRLFEAYGAKQMALGGATVNSQTLANLTYTQALELLALPSEQEREAFVEEHDMAKISTRDLREELRKRQEADTEDGEGAMLAEQFGMEAAGKAQQDSEEAESETELLRAKLDEAEKDRLEAISQMDQAQMQGEEYRKRALKAEQDLQFAQKVKDALKAKSEEAERQAQAAAEKMGALDKQLREARKAQKDAVDALKQAKENPNIPPETLEKLRQEAEAAAAKAHEAAKGDLEEAKKKWVAAEENASKIRQEAEKAKAEAQAAAEKLASVEKALRMAAPEMAEFRFRVQAAQEALTACMTALGALPDGNKQGGAKVLRKLLEAFSGQLTAQA